MSLSILVFVSKGLAGKELDAYVVDLRENRTAFETAQLLWKLVAP